MQSHFCSPYLLRSIYERILQLEQNCMQSATKVVPILPPSRYKQLLERIPAPPSRILEVSVGIKKLQSELVDLGYQTVSCNCTEQNTEIDNAQPPSGEEVAADIGLSFKTYPVTSAPFEVIIFNGSTQKFSLLEIFSKSEELLTSTGEILLLDEFAFSQTEVSGRHGHLLKHVLALADRFGYEVIAQLDASPTSSLNVDYWLAGMTKHAAQIIDDFNLSAATLNEVKQAICTNQTNLLVADRGISLLHLRKAANVPRWRVGKITESSQAQTLNLFNVCFGHDMSPSHWHWKYADGHGQAIGVWEGNDLVAHYGGTTRDILYFGRACKGLYPCDVMVKQAGRGSLSRKSPFFLVTATFLEEYQGYGSKHILALGFPSGRHNAVAKHLGFYYAEEVDHMLEMSWQPLPCKPRVWTEVRKLHSTNRNSERIVNKVWQQMSKDFTEAVIGVRDWTYLQHRYLDHPDKQYEIVVVRNRITKQAHGVIVYRLYDQACELLDIIAPIKNFPTLISQARKLAGCAGVDRLYCWTASNYSQLFEVTGAEARDVDISIPTISWTAGPKLEQIRRRCWLMGGDTDSR